MSKLQKGDVVQYQVSSTSKRPEVGRILEVSVAGSSRSGHDGDQFYVESLDGGEPTWITSSDIIEQWNGPAANLGGVDVAPDCNFTADSDDELTVPRNKSNGLMLSERAQRASKGSEASNGKRSRHRDDDPAQPDLDGARRSPDENVRSGNEHTALPAERESKRRKKAPSMPPTDDGARMSDDAAEPVAPASQVPAADARKVAHDDPEEQERRGLRKWGPAPRTCGAGQVKKIHLQNFSCHENFEIEFNECVTIVHGANGSGKTSIIDALQICLGAKGADTSRATKLAKMIKHGCQEATAKVTVWNTGGIHERFMFEQLGHYFTIVRKIKQTASGNGTSTVHIEDQAGRIWKSDTGQKPAAEVQQLLQQLDINCSSPAVVLNQEKAKTLLAMKGESAEKQGKRLYGIFTKALQLDVARDNLLDAQQNVNLQRIKVQEKRQALDALEKEMNELEAKRAAFEKGEKMKEAGAKLGQYNIWKAVREHERSAEECKQALLALEGDDDAAKQEREARKAKLTDERADLQQQYEVLFTELQQAEAVGNTWKEKIMAKQNEVKAKKRVVNQHTRARAEAESELKSKQQESKSLRAELERLSQSEQAGHNNEMEQWRRKERELKEQVSGSKATVEAAQQELDIAKAEVKAVQAALSTEDAGVASARQDLQRLEHALRDARDSQKSSIGMFGKAPAARLREMVDRDLRNFERPPIGPVGASLSLRDPRWGAAIEQAVGRSYDSWIVHSKRDGDRLRAMARQAGFHGFNSVIYDFDVPQHHWNAAQVPPPELMTVFQQLIIQGPNKDTVANFLIDHHKAELIVIAENLDAGKRVLRSYGEHWRNGSIAAVYTNDDFNMRKAGNSEVIAPLGPKMPPNRLQRDVSEFIANLEAQLPAAREKDAAARAMRDAKRDELAAAKRKQAELERKLHGEESKSQRLLQQFQLCHSQKPDDALELNQSRDEDLGEIEAQILEQEERIKAIDAQIELARNAEAHVFDELQEMKAQKDAAQAGSQEKGVRCTDLRKEVQKRIHALRQLEQEASAIEQERDEILRQQEEFVASAQGIRGDVIEGGDFTTDAEEKLHELRACLEGLWPGLAKADRNLGALGALETVLGDHQVMLSLSNRLQERAIKLLIDLEQKSGSPSLEVLEARIDRLKMKFGLQKKQYGLVSKQIELAQAHVDEREIRYAEVMDGVTKRVKDHFRSNMKRKGNGWSGRIEMKTDTQELIVEVTRPQAKGAANAVGGAVTDLKALSGGERSFTLTMLMLAMGTELSSPFFCMDEYDVYLDAMARVISTRQLFDFAAQSQHIQYIFCTPQDPRPLLEAFEQVRKDAEAKRRTNPGHYTVPENLVVIKSMPPPRAGADI